MTKERLEELIKQEAEIYVVADNHIFKYKLEKKLRPFIGYNGLWVDVFNIPYDYRLNQIFETEADAEKELERQMWKEKIYAERTERFEPPMWEDIENHFTFKWFNDGIEYIFMVDKKNDIVAIETVFDPCINEFDEHATKENYEKACEIVRDLFRGKNE